MNNQRNLLLAVLLCGLLLIGWDLAVNRFWPQPTPKPQMEQQHKAATPAAEASHAAKPPAARNREGGLTDPAEIAEEKKDLASALKSPARIVIDAPEVAGSINLKGAQIDDLVLKTHRQTADKGSPPVRLFSPQGTPAQYFAQFGWVGDSGKTPGLDTVWTADGTRLTHETPVTLRWDNGAGQLYTIRLEVDAQYMLTATQTVANTGTGNVVVQPFGLINRTSETASGDTWTVHSGPISDADGAVDFDVNYDDVAERGEVSVDGKAGWIGFTDIYWLSAMIPQADAPANADFRSRGNGIFRAETLYQPVTVATGRQISRTTRLFAGAKESKTLSAYEAQGIENFNNSIDWGWFEVIAWPIWWLLTHLFGLVGNFGVAIILMTLIIRLLLFPIAQKQFASMAAMRAIQPKMKALQERYKDDKEKQQQEIMALYREEKVNPLAGCLPMLIQIPIFFALYKTLLLAIEMRHQPFVGWIKDLSAPDPAHVLNLFGLLPFQVPGILAIGPLALLLGVTMWLTFRLNPTAMDPMQKQVFALMPWMMMFVMAPFAAGLLIYWITNNVLTLAQQSYLYSRHPQLKAQAEKDDADRKRADERERKSKA